MASKLSIPGLRPGEKLYETLLIDGNAKETLHPKILMANEASLTLEALETVFCALDSPLQRMDHESVFQQLDDLVSGFQPDKNKVDYFW